MSLYTVGEKKQYGTYHPNTIFRDGKPVFTVCGIALHCTREELEADNWINQCFEAPLAFADAVVKLLNEHQPK